MVLTWLCAALVVAVVMGGADAVYVSVAGVVETFPEDSSFIVFAAAALVIQCAVGVLGSLLFAVGESVLSGWRSMSAVGRAFALLVPMAAAAVPIALLNQDYLVGEMIVRPAPGLSYVHQSPIPVWVTVASILAFAVSWTAYLGLLFGRRRWLARIAVLLGVVTTAALIVVNASVLSGLYSRQHWTLTLICWLLLLPALRRLVPRLHSAGTRRKRAFATALVLIAVGTATWQFGSLMGELAPPVRLAFKYRAQHSASAMRLMGILLDFDRDGAIGPFDGGDCAPFDSSVYNGAIEVAGDGLDQNCLGGDPSREDAQWLASFLRGGGLAEPAPEPRSVLLVTIDALRADAPLPRSSSWLAPRCTSYPRSYCTVPNTTPALLSLFSSQYVLGERTTHSPQSETLAQLLSNVGYATGAFFFWAEVMDGEAVHSREALGAGFDEFWVSADQSDEAQHSASEVTVDHALDWLAETSGRPFFLWVHLYNPHYPYQPHRPETSNTIWDRYLDEVDYTDGQLLRLLEAVSELHDPAIVVTGDHGEAMGEHGAYYHNSSVFEEQIRVPLWLCPGPFPGAQRPEPISHIDIAPTVSDMAGLFVPEPSWSGRSLLAAEPADVPVFSRVDHTWGPVRAVISGPWKLIYFRRDNVPLLYHVVADPTEQRSLELDHPEVLAPLVGLLDVWMAMMEDGY